MKTSVNETIRQAVRENYGDIARAGGPQLKNEAAGSCCAGGSGKAAPTTGCGCGDGKTTSTGGNAWLNDP